MPVRGWWLPIVMVVLVMPGADAVSAVLPPVLPVVVDDELQAAAARLRAASPATAAILAGCDLIMFFLSPCGQPPANTGATKSSSCPRARRAGRSAGPPRL